MSIARDFRLYSAVCRRMLAGGRIDEHRETLREMAQAWERLAVEEERIADLARVLDQLLPERTAIRRRNPDGLLQRLVGLHGLLRTKGTSAREGAPKRL